MPKQLRGEPLNEAIRAGISKLAKQSGETYVYNATHVADLVGTSRATLNNKAELVEEILEDIKADRRKSNNEGLIEAFQIRIERIEKENGELKDQVIALQKNHVEIYRQLYMHSVDGAALVAPFVRTDANEDCPLCGHETGESKTNSKVVPIRGKKSKGN